MYFDTAAIEFLSLNVNHVPALVHASAESFSRYPIAVLVCWSK